MLKISGYTSFSELMRQVNNSQDKVKAMSEAVSKLNGFDRILKHYFGVEKIDFSDLTVMSVRRKIPDGVKFSFQSFLKDIKLYSCVMDPVRKNNIFNDTVEWMFESDVEFISKLISGEEIPEFTEFGLENFESLTLL